MSTSPRIAVIGAGAVGCYYGGRLAEAGHDVRFLMRRDYDAVRERGLFVSSVDGDFQLEQPSIARTSEEIGSADWIICALKATSIDDVTHLLQPCLTPQTKVLVLMNGLGLEERFAAWFGQERIFGGLAFTCINRGEPGVVHHLRYGRLTIGHYLDDERLVGEAVGLWDGTKVEVVAARSLLMARWEKLCWNIPFNGITIAGGGITTEQALARPDLRQATAELMREVVAVANADLQAHVRPERIEADEMVERMFSLTETMGDYRPSTLIDFLEGRSMEIEAMFAEPLRRAKSLGVDAPRIELMTALLQSLNEDREQRALAPDRT